MSRMDRYEWMENTYGGAAHGRLGTFFAILQFTERVQPGSDIHVEVAAGLDWILDLEENRRSQVICACLRSCRLIAEQ